MLTDPEAADCNKLLLVLCVPGQDRLEGLVRACLGSLTLTEWGWFRRPLKDPHSAGLQLWLQERAKERERCRGSAIGRLSVLYVFRGKKETINYRAGDAMNIHQTTDKHIKSLLWPKPDLSNLHALLPKTNNVARGDLCDALQNGRVSDYIHVYHLIWISKYLCPIGFMSCFKSHHFWGFQTGWNWHKDSLIDCYVKSIFLLKTRLLMLSLCYSLCLSLLCATILPSSYVTVGSEQQQPLHWEQTPWTCIIFPRK